MDEFLGQFVVMTLRWMRWIEAEQTRQDVVRCDGIQTQMQLEKRVNGSRRERGKEGKWQRKGNG